MEEKMVRVTVENTKETKETVTAKETQMSKKQAKTGKTYYDMIKACVLGFSTFSKKDILKELDINPNSIYYYLDRLKKEGVIEKLEGEKGLYRTKASNATGVFETFLRDEDYSRILKYILTRNDFEVEALRKILNERQKNLIPEVIEALNEKKLIVFREEKEAYEVTLTSRVWYETLKYNGQVHDSYIANKLKYKVNDLLFVQALRDSVKLQLIVEKPQGNIFYAKLNIFFNFIPNIIYINFSFRRKRICWNITNRI